MIPKVIVAGVRDRATGQIKAQVVENVEAKTLLPFINQQRDESETRVYTDDLVSYHGLKNHAWVNHSAGEYVRGRNNEIHTNGIEGFWASLKRGIKGTYVGVSAHHLQRYVNEAAAKHNMRSLPVLVKMFLITRGLDNRVLRYQDLVQAA